MRLIDADTLIEIFCDRAVRVSSRFGSDSSELGILMGAMKLVEIQPTVDLKPQWVLCKDKLPGSVDVLCRDIHGDICIASPYEDEDSNTGYSAGSDLTYMIDCIEWMPLPEPYRGEK